MRTEMHEFAAEYYDLWIAPVKRLLEITTSKTKKRQLQAELKMLLAERDAEIAKRFPKEG